MKFDHLPQFTICDTKSEEYGEWVDKTARLLKRPYAQMHLLFTREKWTLEKIRDRYVYVTKHNGKMPSAVLWWHLRKVEKAKSS